MTPQNFSAQENHSKSLCYLCKKCIEINELVRYYGGPFLMHTACIEKIGEPHESYEKPGGGGANG